MAVVRGFLVGQRMPYWYLSSRLACMIGEEHSHKMPEKKEGLLHAQELPENHVVLLETAGLTNA